MEEAAKVAIKAPGLSSAKLDIRIAKIPRACAF